MPNLLTTATVMMCPHGGTVTATSANTRAKAVGAFILRPSDTFIVVGCVLNVAGAPHPCVQVQWAGASRSKAADDTTLNETSTGLCVAGDQAVQGTVLIMTTQPKVAGQ
jgi:hypothetical protein